MIMPQTAVKYDTEVTRLLAGLLMKLMWLFLSVCRCGTSGQKLTCTPSLATPTPWLQSDVRLQNRKSSPVNKSYTINQRNLTVR